MSDRLTVGELRKALSNYKDSDILEFAGKLTFYRLKSISPTSVFLEFNQYEAPFQGEVQNKHPEVQAIFCRVGR